MDKDEIKFWEDMIEKYLKPLDENKEQKKKAKEKKKEQAGENLSVIFLVSVVDDMVRYRRSISAQSFFFFNVLCFT